MYIYNRVRDLREDLDLTQAQIAKYLEVGTTTYRRWETGEREIPLHIIIKLANKYNVSLDYIAGLTTIQNPYKIFINPNKSKSNK